MCRSIQEQLEDQEREKRPVMDAMLEAHCFLEEMAEDHPLIWGTVGRAFEMVESVPFAPSIGSIRESMGIVEIAGSYATQHWMDGLIATGRTPLEREAYAVVLPSMMQKTSRAAFLMGGVTAGARGVLGRLGRGPRPGVLAIEGVGLPELGTMVESGYVPRYWQRAEVFTSRAGQANKVYKRNDLIDLTRVGKDGRTNLQRMKDGDAPIGIDGWSINLHHLTQTQEGAIAEVLGSMHNKNHRMLHIWSNGSKGGVTRAEVRPSIDRPAFEKWKTDYWQARVKELLGE